MRLMASYRVRNGSTPAKPMIHHMPDPCMYGHVVRFVAEVLAMEDEDGRSPTYYMEVNVDQPVVLTYAMSVMLDELHGMIDALPGWLEYRWKMYVARGSCVGMADS